jgi:hypothetical protein
MGGIPPDWQAIVLLRDIVPWAGQILYAILAAIQALLDAFSGVMQEIKDFIDLLIRKIDALERFIKFIIQLMEYVLSLDVSCYALNISGITKGIPELMEAIDNAGGDKPPLDPGGYSAGVVLAYVAPNIDGYVKALLDELRFSGHLQQVAVRPLHGVRALAACLDQCPDLAPRSR